MNKSKQRDAILTVLRSTKSHPTAEWVHERAKELVPNISLATVYRNLDQLLENGDIIKVQGVFDKDRYDGNSCRHAHMVCSNCENIIDLEIEEQLDNRLMKLFPECGILNYNLVYDGLCPLCINTLKGENNE